MALLADEPDAMHQRDPDVDLAGHRSITPIPGPQVICGRGLGWSCWDHSRPIEDTGILAMFAVIRTGGKQYRVTSERYP